MAVNLKGIDELVIAIDPSDFKTKAFSCVGYSPKPLERGLVDIYKPVGQPIARSYTLSELENFTELQGAELKRYVRAG